MNIDAVLSLVPHEYWEVAGLVLTGLIGVRSVLGAVVAVCTWVDMRDGVIDWSWVGRCGDFLARVDAVLERLPVKAPFVKGKKP